MSDGLQHGERGTVLIEHEKRDDEELEVFDYVRVLQEHHVNSVNGYETFVGPILEGDGSSGQEPEAITKRVADLLWDEFSIDGEISEREIRVVDMSADNVSEL